MRMLKGNVSEERKLEVKKIIGNIISNVCTGDFNTCTYGRCGFNKKCDKHNLRVEALPNKNRPLENILKLVKEAMNVKTGRKLPTSRPNGIHAIASDILGQDIYEHDLVKDCPTTTIRIKNAKSLGQMASILRQKHQMVTGKIIRFPTGKV